nr:hypothetical protein [Tanacetum cinerariifolium]
CPLVALCTLPIQLTEFASQKNRDPAFAEMLETQQAKDSGKGKKAAKSEKEEDAELLQDEDDDDVYVYNESPPCKY